MLIIVSKQEISQYRRIFAIVSSSVFWYKKSIENIYFSKNHLFSIQFSSIIFQKITRIDNDYSN